jgi:hypothetical protein
MVHQRVSLYTKATSDRGKVQPSMSTSVVERLGERSIRDWRTAGMTSIALGVSMNRRNDVTGMKFDWVRAVAIGGLGVSMPRSARIHRACQSIAVAPGSGTHTRIDSCDVDMQIAEWLRVSAIGQPH